MTMTTPPPTQATTDHLSAARSAKDIVLEFYEDFDGGRLGSSEAVAPEFEATVFGTTVLDRPGFVAFGQSFLAAFSDGRHEFDFVVAEGDTVATIGQYRGCHDGTLMGVAPTGNQVDFCVMHVDRVSDGRIVEHRGIGDINTDVGPTRCRPTGGLSRHAPAGGQGVDELEAAAHTDRRRRHDATGRSTVTGSSPSRRRSGGSAGC